MQDDRQAQDFETMLRVRLDRHRGRMSGRDGGGSERNADSCRGFDPERASAFLEDALSIADATRYEDHLAGCLACRQAVIELYRLPIAVAGSLNEPVQVPSRLSAVQSGGFKAFLKSLRSAPFQWAGAAAATCGIVLALSMFLMRQESIRTQPSESASNPARMAGTAQALPTPEAAQQVDRFADVASGTASSKSNSVPFSTNGQITNQRGLVSQPVLPNTESLDRIFGRVPNRQIAQLSPSALGGTAPQFNVPYNAAPVAPQFVPQIGSQITPQMAQAIPPSPQGVQEQTELMRADSLAGQSKDQAQRPAARESSLDKRKSSSAAMDFLPRSFLKGPTPTPTPNIADEDIRALTRKIHDKTFRFDRGRWVDQQFKPGLLYIRVRIDRGSEQYKKILSDIPALQPFFDLGPVIVVWELKVYEVR